MHKSSEARRSGRKRKSNQALTEFEIDDDIPDTVQLKRSRRLSSISFASYRTHCQKIVDTLWDHKYGWPFHNPVDPVALNIPDYFDKIKHPMDLGTVKQKIEAHEYVDVEDFATDVRLVFNNCCTYNQAGSDVYVMGEALGKMFEKQYKKLVRNPPPVKVYATAEEEIEDMQKIVAELQQEYEKLVAELEMLRQGKGGVVPTANGQGKGKRPKKETKRVDVKVEADTFSVKQKQALGEKINKLEPEDLQQMVGIIAGDLPESAKQNNELEVDLEVLQVSTLKKLDAFVNTCLQRRGIVIESNDNGKKDSSSSDSDSSSESDSSDSESDREKQPQPQQDAAPPKPNDASM